MECRVFLLLLVSGLCTLSSCFPHQYHFVNMSKSWTEAQSYCREKYTDLVAIDNPEEMNRVINSVNLTGYTGPVWIGLEKGNSWKWQWSLEERRLYSDGQTGFWNWDTGRGAPHTANGNDNCVAMSDNGKWNDQSCDYKSSTGFFVCYDASPSQPPGRLKQIVAGQGKDISVINPGKDISPSQRTEQTSQRYVFINQNKNWMEAQRYCRENHTDLVSVRNQTENGLIQKMFKTRTFVWIGLYRDYWQWSDQRKSSFRYWAPGKPDNYDGKENCAVAWFTYTDSGTWDDGQCGENHPFLCYDVSVPLILVQENMTWNEALNYCRQNYVDLVLVQNKEIQQWVENKAEKATSAHVWMGLRFSCRLKLWFWVTGDVACYQNWVPGNGTGAGHCGNTGAVESGGGHQWVSLPETEKLNFICSK